MISEFRCPFCGFFVKGIPGVIRDVFHDHACWAGADDQIKYIMMDEPAQDACDLYMKKYVWGA